MSKKLYGYASKDNLEYQWKSEPTACEVCKSMNGKIYKSANDIPDRPHPNCKCWIDILEKESDEPITDPIKAYREKLKDKKRNKLELGKLLGDVKSLEQEIYEYIRQTEEQENEIAKLEHEFDTEPLAEKDKQKLSDLKEQLDFAQYKGQKAKKDIQNLKTKIQNSTGSIEEITKFEFEVRNISQYVDSMIQNIKKLSKERKEKLENFLVYKVDKDIAISYAKLHNILFNMPESYNFFKIGVDKEYNKSYVLKNGKMYDSIYDLNNNELIKTVKNRIEHENRNNINKKNDSKVLVLNSNSSVAKAIEKSYELDNFIQNNINKLKQGQIINQYKIEFKNNDTDLYSTFHGAIINNAYLDKEENLNLRVEDFYNFEPGRTSVKGRVGEKLQNQGDLKTFYVIVVLKIPKNIWLK
ncbi:hypothetical protein IJ425_02415 [bacterium]|nr:hypothetical protein [bacterium]